MEKENFEKITACLLELATPFPQVAADQILNPKYRNRLEQSIDNVLRFFSRDVFDVVYNKTEKQEVLIEIALNLLGMERKKVGFSQEEIEKTIEKIIATLKKREKNEEKDKPITKSVIKKFLDELKQVGFGKSMVAKIAENIEKKLDQNNLMDSFILALKYEIENNVYFKMAEKGMSKFGNDSATGLRFVRHLDFVQVSSNPVIAARAYEEFPELWDNFKEIVKTNPEWQKNPEKYADEITMYATITSLLPNLLAFRPIALISDFRDGLVSLQLNPFLAEDPRATIRGAKQIYSILEKILYQYDAWLGWNSDIYNGRPNIVFKVAASSASAIDITSALNSIGIGTNNTVTYSVSQELTLLITEAEGMARALKNGAAITQVYQTNMLGRLSDHLKDVVGDDPEKQEAIKYSGIYITRKIYKLFFSPENRIKWQAYLKKKFNLSDSQVKEIFNKIDLLPASKRKPEDTYLVLGGPNITNTEFPTHQTKVWEESLKDGFNLEKYRDSINKEPDPKILEKLLEIEDFREAYELTPELTEKLKEVGIKTSSEKNGIQPEDWPKFGPVVKTMTEFKNAYLDFQKKVIDFVKNWRKE